ncbi:hypothetical protein M9Y10_020742 [Tritrichomonas musculus]|uniref:Caspase family p20 domain-containing protein n=1 Tax=Tritrichomonas musculus TaxID=1915356 RepID=A0ABR2HGG7_9EUKA
MQYIDEPEKKQKVSHYEKGTAKLDIKNNEFTSKKFQEIRKLSTHKKLLESFHRIGMCLNNKYLQSIPLQGLDKVCFILMNDYDEEDSKLGVGPLNDGYLIGLKHFKIGYKVFYLYNCPMEEFLLALGFMIRNAKENLTVFYSGRDDKIMDGIEFSDGTLFRDEIAAAITKFSTEHQQIMFITDCLSGGSVFDIDGCPNAVSFYVKKAGNGVKKSSKEIKQTHGIFTYYFCKITNENPKITPNKLVEKMNLSLNRFVEEFAFETTNDELNKSPVFQIKS